VAPCAGGEKIQHPCDVDHTFQKPGSSILVRVRWRLGSTTMLAEIFLLRTETLLRASKESTSASNSQFVPITLPAAPKPKA
jgi:hypothetical protein